MAMFRLLVTQIVCVCPGVEFVVCICIHSGSRQNPFSGRKHSFIDSFVPLAESGCLKYFSRIWWRRVCTRSWRTKTCHFSLFISLPVCNEPSLRLFSNVDSFDLLCEILGPQSQSKHSVTLNVGTNKKKWYNWKKVINFRRYFFWWGPTILSVWCVPFPGNRP